MLEMINFALILYTCSTKKLVAILLALFATWDVSMAVNGCSGSDCIYHEIGSQASCKEVECATTYDCRWPAGLDTNADYIIEGGDIIAYWIHWFNGTWSGWFVTGVNDIHIKSNTNGRTCDIPPSQTHVLLPELLYICVYTKCVGTNKVHYYMQYLYSPTLL